MAGWNFDRIMDTVNIEHHSIRCRTPPGLGSTNADKTCAEQKMFSDTATTGNG